MKPRIFYLDIIRSIACLMVILMHTPKPGSANGIILSTISLFTAPCIGLFFMVSGALLLPVKESALHFLKKRFSKIFSPLILWSLFYIGVNVNSYPDTTSLLRAIFSIPFSTQGNGVLWFLYTMAGLYLLAPILSAWLEHVSRKELEFYLFLWVISLCYPFIQTFLDVSRNNTGILYYFTGYAGYFILGYYLNRFQPKINNLFLIFLFCLPFIVAVILKSKKFELDFYDMFWYLSISVSILCFVWFTFVSKYYSFKTHCLGGGGKIITNFSNCSFGIYLLHIFILRNIIWTINSPIFDGIHGIFITFILTTIITYLIIYFLSTLPFSKYLIGYHTKIKIPLLK